MNYLNKKTVEDIDVAGKKVLVRCDFNVPFDGEGNISEVTSLTENVTLAVWRIEDDDTTTLVADGIANDGES